MLRSTYDHLANAKECLLRAYEELCEAKASEDENYEEATMMPDVLDDWIETLDYDVLRPVARVLEDIDDECA